MTANPWPGRAASIIVLPSGEVGTAIFVQAQAWARAGLIGAAFWVRPEDAKLEDATDFALPATILGPVDSRPADVLAQLARAEFRRIRLVAVKVATEIGLQDEQQQQVLRRVHEVLERVAPVPGGAALADDFPRVIRINTVTVPPWAGPVDVAKAIEIDWHWNLLLSNENRITPFGIDAVIRTTGEMVGTILSNLAAVAGLWIGVPRSSIEQLHTDASSVVGSVWIHRTFARGIIHQGLISGTAHDALVYAADPEADLFDPVEGLQPTDLAPVDAHQRDQLLELLVDESLKLRGQALSYKRPPAFVPPSQEKIGAIRQVREFLAFSWDKIKLLPLLAARAIANWLSKSLTRIFQGRGGKKTVDIQLDVRPLRQDKRDLQLFAEVDAIKALLEDLKVSKKPRIDLAAPSVPGLWGDLRRLMFASLDGSEAPEGVQLPRTVDAQLPLVLRKVSDLVFDPSDRWRVPDPVMELDESLRQLPAISWKSLERADEVLSELLRLNESLQKNLEQKLLELEQVEEQGI